MPKRLKIQRRGKAKPRYLARTHKALGKISYGKLVVSDEIIEGNIVSISNCSIHSAPLMKILYKNGISVLLPAVYGIWEGMKVYVGKDVEISPGNITTLENVPEGTEVSSLEILPGQNVKAVRSAGSFATVVSHSDKGVQVKMPSKKIIFLNPKCKVVIGKVAGGGAKEKPVVKAGKKYHMMKNKAKVWPIVAGTTMAPVDHPFGGGRRSNHKQKSIKRSAPSGKKVGSISPKRTGRKKR